jgi:hypothetical protein
MKPTNVTYEVHRNRTRVFTASSPYKCEQPAMCKAIRFARRAENRPENAMVNYRVIRVERQQIYQTAQKGKQCT